MSQEENKQGKNIDIQIDKDVASGVYSNLALINHSPTEFIVDFIQMMPGLKQAQVKSRIILTPQHARRLMAALNDNIQKFERQFGEVKDADVATPLNFGTKGQA